MAKATKIVLRDDEGGFVDIRGEPSFLHIARQEAAERDMPTAQLVRWWAQLGRLVEQGKFGELRRLGDDDVVRSQE